MSEYLGKTLYNFVKNFYEITKHKDFLLEYEMIPFLTEEMDQFVDRMKKVFLDL